MAKHTSDYVFFTRRVASLPLSTDNMQSTWNPPDWEEVVSWWDEAVTDARKLTGLSYPQKV